MTPIAPSLETPEVRQHAQGIFDGQCLALYKRTDRLMAVLMGLQWIGMILAAGLLSPYAWEGVFSQAHPTFWAVVFLSGLISLVPILLAIFCPGRMVTRQVIAGVQILISVLLIHMTGGHITTYLHMFCSLAFLSFYRDWRVIASATSFLVIDHLVTDNLLALPLYYKAASAPWLLEEHLEWVALEDIFLLISCRRSLREMRESSLRQAQLEVAEGILLKAHETLERRVEERTAALDQMRRENEMLLNSAGEGIYGLDAQGRTSFANPAAARMLGYEVEELIGQPMHALLHHTRPDGSFYPSHECPIYAAVHDGEVHHVDDEVFWRKDGTSFAVEYMSTPLREDGELVGAVVTFQDITERRRAEEKLRQTEEKLRTIIETAPLVLSSFDENGVFTVSEGCGLKVLGLLPGQAVGHSLFAMYADHPMIVDKARRVLGGETVDYISELDTLAFETHQYPTRDAEGNVNGGISVSLNVTARVSAERKLQQLHTELEAAYQDTLNAYDATIAGLSRALDYRDQETHGHSERVTEMALRLARNMGIDETALVQVRRGALLHDIGKMAVPDNILLKPGPLTDEEWVIMRCHPDYACEMLWPIEFLRPALDIPVSHHEKWDGTGYPLGLAGEDIPLAARIFAIVDVWDALSSDRPYRSAWPHGRIADHLHSLSGTHFDPQVVTAFLQLLDSLDVPIRETADHTLSHLAA